MDGVEEWPTEIRSVVGEGVDGLDDPGLELVKAVDPVEYPASPRSSRHLMQLGVIR